MKHRLLSLSLGLSMLFANMTAIHAEDSRPSEDPAYAENKLHSFKEETAGAKSKQPTESVYDNVSGSIKPDHDYSVGYFTDFETDPETEGWLFIDHNQDSRNWEWSRHDSDHASSGQGSLYSVSFSIFAGDITPDDWAVSPAVTVPEGRPVVSFMATGLHEEYCQEVIGIYVLPVSSDVEPAVTDDWVQVGSDITMTYSYQKYVFDLSDYADQTVRIAIRHYHCEGQFGLHVDDFGVGSFYSISFDPTGGTVSPAQAETGVDARLSTLPVAENIGYAFTGWYTEPEGGELITTDTVFTDDVTLYAHWTEAPIITFDANKGTVEPEQKSPQVNGTLYTLPEAVRENYYFDGWYTEPEGGEEITLDTVFTEDTTIYAHWKKLNTIYGTSFETDEDVEDWIFFDYDGDGLNWVRYDEASLISAYEGTGYLYSESVYIFRELTPDNWAIAPAIDLPPGNSSVSFMACGYYNHLGDAFSIYAIDAESGLDWQDPDNWTQLSDFIIAPEDYTEYTADLSSFAGRKTYVAIRHYNCTDCWTLNVDAFKITNDNAMHKVMIADDITDGTVTADMEDVYYGETVTLSYEADPYYEFDGWVVTDSAGNPVEVTEDNTFVMPDDDVIVSADFYITVLEFPQLVGTSLLLDGRIGLVFYYDLPQIDVYKYDKVDFTVIMPNGKTESSSWSYDDARKKDGLYGFVCYVNSIQMADGISASLLYTENGKNNVLNDVYSVKDYIAASEHQEDGELTDAQVLTHAIADYGHYAQRFLSEARGWTIGTDYADMDKYYANSFNEEEIRDNVLQFTP